MREHTHTHPECWSCSFDPTSILSLDYHISWKIIDRVEMLSHTYVENVPKKNIAQGLCVTVTWIFLMKTELWRDSPGFADGLTVLHTPVPGSFREGTVPGLAENGPTVVR